MTENHQKLYRPQCIVHTTLQNVLSLLDIVVWMEKGICLCWSWWSERALWWWWWWQMIVWWGKPSPPSDDCDIEAEGAETHGYVVLPHLTNTIHSEVWRITHLTKQYVPQYQKYHVHCYVILHNTENRIRTMGADCKIQGAVGDSQGNTISRSGRSCKREPTMICRQISTIWSWNAILMLPRRYRVEGSPIFLALYAGSFFFLHGFE